MAVASQVKKIATFNAKDFKHVDKFGMKLDIVTQRVTVLREKAMHLSTGLVLGLERMDQAANLIAELAPN